jgi:hypothetical protein
MKTRTLTLIGIITLGVFGLAKCESDDSLLSNQNSVNGKFLIKNKREIPQANYAVDENFLIKSTKEISDVDIKKLLYLNEKYAPLTKGKTFLNYIVNTQQIRQLTIFDHLSQISRIQRLNQIHKGCFEKAQIDWLQFRDLKLQLDAVLNKYSPALVNQNVSIVNNQITTKVVRINDEHISKLGGISIYGIDDATICGDYMGLNKFTTFLRSVNNVGINEELNIRLEEIISQYQ